MNFVIDTLVIVDEAAKEFWFKGAEIFVLLEGDGIGKALALFRAGVLKAEHFKFVVLLGGKADLLESDRYFWESLFGLIEWFEGNRPTALLILMAGLPLPTDSQFQVRMTGYRAGFISRIAEEKINVEFSRPGKRLLKPGGIILEFYDQQGYLN